LKDQLLTNINDKLNFC